MQFYIVGCIGSIRCELGSLRFATTLTRHVIRLQGFLVYSLQFTVKCKMALDLPRSLTGFGCMLIVVRLGLITFMREIEIEKWNNFSQLLLG